MTGRFDGLRWAACAAGAVLAAAPMATSPAAAQQQQNERDTGLLLEEMIVTAERREARLQDVPVAVSAFDAVEIERRQAFNVVDIVNNVPNLVGNNNIGQGSATTVFLRGVGTTESIVTVDTALGFYLDDVFIARQGVNNFSLYDIERVEVLRGPQGTLYGRNTSGGAIKVITRKPDNEFEAYGEASYGRFDRYDIKASVNAPVVDDKLFVRVNGLVQQGDGYTDNTTLDRDVNDRDFYGVRAGVRYVVTDDLEVLVTADYSRSEQAGLYAVDVAGIVRPTTGDLFTVVSGTDSENIGRAWGVHMTVDWSPSDAFQLQSITAFRNTFQRWNLDLTDQVVPLFVLFTINDSDQYSQELRATGTLFNGRLDYVGGFFYFDESSFSFIGDSIDLTSLGGGPLAFSARDYDVDVQSWAAFAELNYHLTDKLTLILGGRFTKDDKSLRITQTIGAPPGFSGAGGAPGFNTATLEALGTPTDLEFDEFTPKAGVRYHVTDDVTAYFTYTQGFRSGGWSARTNDAEEVVVFDPEFVNSFEVGVKATLLGGRARVNTVGFFYDYEDLFNSATGAGGNFIVATNDAEVYGIEIEATGRVTENLDVFGFFGWQDAEYKGVDPDLAGVVIGEELQRLPEFSFKIGFTQTWPTEFGLFRLTADYSFQEDHFTNLQNSDLGRSGDINLVSAALGWESEDGRFGVTASCRNCNNDAYITQSVDFAASLGFLAVYPAEPRTWLLTFKARTG